VGCLRFSRQPSNPHATFMKAAKKLVSTLTHLGAAMVFAAGTACARPEASGASKPNVLLIVVDDLNDWVGPLAGHPQARTPNVDRFAREGVTFTNAHSQVPICHPSRVSFMTGMRPSTTGLYSMGPLDFRKGSEVLRDPASTPTLSEYFARAGYRTLGVGKIFHSSSATETFQEYGPRGDFGPFPTGGKLVPVPGEKLWDWGRFPERDEDTVDHEVAQWAVAQLRQTTERPFFLAVGFFRPHAPMYAPGKWWDLIGDPASIVMPPHLPNDNDDISEFALALTYARTSPRHQWMQESGEWRRAVHGYLACVSFVDAQIGKVLAALEATPQHKNTIVVITSDHGLALGEKSRWGKRALWERETRVPLIVRAPGINGGRICAEPAGLIDLYPTLLELSRLPAAAHLEGRSLMPQLRDVTAPRDAVLSTFSVNNHAVRSKHFRYLRYADGSEELYDHRIDPNEWRNLIGQPGARLIADRLATSLPVVNVPPVRGSGGLGVNPRHLDWFGGIK